MALLVNQAPFDGQSAHFNLWHSVNTTLFSEPTLRCVFDIYIGNTRIYRARIYPLPSLTVHAFFDAGPVIRNHFNKYFLPSSANTNFISWHTNGYYIDYTVKYGEEYISPTTGLPVTNYDQSTTTHRVYNAYPEHLQGGNIIAIPGPMSLLSDRDLTQWHFVNGQHNFFGVRKTTATTFNIQTRNVSSSWTAGQSLTASTLGELVQIDINKASINHNLGAYDEAVDKRVKVRVWDNTTGNIQFDLLTWCHPKYQPVCITFLNKYGAYETMVFGLVSKRTINMETGEYGSTGFAFKTSALSPNPPNTTFYVSTARNYDPATKVYYPQHNVSYKKQALMYTLNTDLLTEKNYYWLKQLIASPEIYMQRGEYFYPVVITDSNWVEKLSTTDGAFNLTINIKSFDILSLND
jgi:hypothetical protein